MYGNDVASDFQMALRVADEQSPFGKRLQIFCHVECSVKLVMLSICSIDVLWGQQIKLIQVASNPELRENQWNDLLFFEIVPSHCFGASEVQT